MGLAEVVHSNEDTAVRPGQIEVWQVLIPHADVSGGSRAYGPDERARVDHDEPGHERDEYDPSPSSSRRCELVKRTRSRRRCKVLWRFRILRPLDVLKAFRATGLGRAEGGHGRRLRAAGDGDLIIFQASAGESQDPDCTGRVAYCGRRLAAMYPTSRTSLCHFAGRARFASSAPRMPVQQSLIAGDGSVNARRRVDRMRWRPSPIPNSGLSSSESLASPTSRWPRRLTS